MPKLLIAFLLVFITSSIVAQTDTTSVLKLSTQPKSLKAESKFEANPFDANAPAKAAFYSAVLPGLGQAYNKSYWKIPLVYGAIGASTYFYIFNNNEYNRYRDAYKSRLAGFEDDEFFGVLTNENLIDAQKQFRQNKEYSLLFIIGFYILNIIDANVEAHLNQFNVSRDLSVSPQIKPNHITRKPEFNLTFNLKLN
jgi:hypothetical protein